MIVATHVFIIELLRRNPVSRRRGGGLLTESGHSGRGHTVHVQATRVSGQVGAVEARHGGCQPCGLLSPLAFGMEKNTRRQVARRRWRKTSGSRNMYELLSWSD